MEGGRNKGSRDVYSLKAVKMKLYSIINFFGRVSPSEREKLGDRVFRKVSDFNRKAEMIPTIMTMRELNKAYEDERSAKVMELIQNHCDEQNAKDEGKKGYKKLIPGENVNVVPDCKVPEFRAWHSKRILAEIKSIAPIKFLPEEIEAADKEESIDPEILIGFADFYDIKELTAYVKTKKDAKAKIETEEVLPESQQDSGDPPDNL